MDELEQARAEVQKRREGLRKVEAELKEALVDRDALEPKGLLGMFQAAPDPARIEELDTIIEVLREEHRLRREAFRKAHDAMEQLETDAQRGAVMPTGVDDVDGAVVAIQALHALDGVLRDLHNVASKAERARDAVPMTRLGRRGRHAPVRVSGAKKTNAVLAHTDTWEPLVDQAELLADVVGLPLVLPRRYAPEIRPNSAPQPAADVELARQAAVSKDMEAFGLAIAFACGDLDALMRRAWNVTQAVEERFPDARGLAAGRPFDPMASRLVASDAEHDPLLHLADHWEGLRSAHDTLDMLAARGARTAAYLDAMGTWQRHAKAVAASPVAQQHQLVPPINDGGPLVPFVERVLAEWPDLDLKYRFQTGRR